jgi:ankyrin repeat protein
MTNQNQYLLETTDLTPTSPDPNSYTPLHAAASYSHLDLLAYLLGTPQALARPNAINVCDADGDTPLFTAESVETARWLVEHGADVEWRNEEGLNVGCSCLRRAVLGADLSIAV